MSDEECGVGKRGLRYAPFFLLLLAYGLVGCMLYKSQPETGEDDVIVFFSNPLYNLNSNHLSYQNDRTL